MDIGARSLPKSIRLFTALAVASWIDESTSLSEKVPQWMVSRRLSQKEARSNIDVNLIWRGDCVRLKKLLQLEIQKKIVGGIPPNRASNLATIDLFTKLSEVDSELETSSMKYNFEHFLNKLRGGERWQELIDAIEAREILLIDESIAYEDFTDSYRTPKQNDEDENEKGSDDYHMVEDNIIKSGTNIMFQTLKGTLLTTELHLRQTCQLMSWVTNMIEQLKADDQSYLSLLLQNTKDGGQDKRQLSPSLKVALASRIQHRIRSVFVIY